MRHPSPPPTPPLSLPSFDYNQDSLIFGVDIGGTSVRAALAHSPASIIVKTRRPSPAQQPPEAMVQAVRDMYLELLSQAGRSSAIAVGVSSPGPVDTVAGALVDPPNLPLYDTVPLRDMLREALDLPVALENDANAAAIAEHRVGLGLGTQHLAYVTLSTGIGAGLISDGQLVRGARGAAGEVGHIKLMVDGPECGCGQKGCWEALASGAALHKEAIRLIQKGTSTSLSDLQPSLIDAQAIFESAQSGDSLANRILYKAAYFTGVGLAAIVDVLNPEIVIVGGGLTHMGPRLLKPAFETCREHIFPLHERDLRLEESNLGDDVSLIGALVLAQESAQSRVEMK